jgi:hypothetical protein
LANYQIWEFVIKNKISGLIYGEGSTARKSSARKTARHQNLDCSTLFEQMPKNETAQKTPKKLFQADASFRTKYQLLKLQLLDKNIEKCQLLEFKKVESLEHVQQFG